MNGNIWYCQSMLTKHLKEEWEWIKTVLPFVAERQNICLMTLYTLWILLPGDSLGVKALKLFGTYVNEAMLGTFYGILIVVHCAALIIHYAFGNTYIRQTRLVRRWCVFAETIAWLIQGVTAVLSYYPSFAGITFLYFFAVSRWAFSALGSIARYEGRLLSDGEISAR